MQRTMHKPAQFITVRKKNQNCLTVICWPLLHKIKSLAGAGSVTDGITINNYSSSLSRTT